MKVVLTQLNVGSKFRFMPSGANGTYISNKPRDGWLTEAAARKWAEKNGHEIVKVEKAAGKGEKIYNIEYTYKDRFGKTKKFTSALVGKDVEPLKKRIVEGLTRNGDKLISFGKITTKDSAEDSTLVSRIAEKYALDAIGAGVVVPSFKAKTDVFKRLAQGNGPNDFNKAKKGLLDIVETIKKEIERQKSRNIPQKQKDEILKRLNKELEEAKQSIEIYKKGRNIQPQTTKQWNRAMLRKDSADEFENDVMTYPVNSNRNGSKYGFIEKICKTKAEAEALVESLKKKGLVASYKGVIYRDSSDTMERIKAKYCLDAVGYSYADLKTALALGDIKPNQRMVSSVGGGMAKTAKEWLDMGMKVVNANKPYPLDKLKKR